MRKQGNNSIALKKLHGKAKGKNLILTFENKKHVVRLKVNSILTFQNPTW